MEKQVFDIEKIKKIAHEHIGMFLGILALIAISIAICVGIYSVTPIAGRKYWYEDNGHFPWVGVSAFLAGIGLILNAMQNRRKFKADLISKSRLELMKEGRKKISSFSALESSRYKDKLDVETSRLYVELAPDFESKKNHQSIYYDKVDENNENITNIQIAEIHLKLLFTGSEKNKELQICISELGTKANSLDRAIENAAQRNIDRKNIITAYYLSIDPEVIQANDEFNKALNELIKCSSEYFQREWEKVKSGN